MNLYILKTESSVTQAQLNVTGARTMDKVRRSNDGQVVLEASPEVAATFFVNDRWFTLTEAREEMAKPEWQGGSEDNTLMQLLGFFTA